MLPVYMIIVYSMFVRGIIYVIDSSSFQKEVKDVAQYVNIIILLYISQRIFSR